MCVCVCVRACVCVCVHVCLCVRVRVRAGCIRCSYTAATVYTMLIVGIVLAIMSIAVWVSTIKATKCCSKFVRCRLSFFPKNPSRGVAWRAGQSWLQQNVFCSRHHPRPRPRAFAFVRCGLLFKRTDTHTHVRLLVRTNDVLRDTLRWLLMRCRSFSSSAWCFWQSLRRRLVVVVVCSTTMDWLRWCCLGVRVETSQAPSCLPARTFRSGTEQTVTAAV